MLIGSSVLRASVPSHIYEVVKLITPLFLSRNKLKRANRVWMNDNPDKDRKYAMRSIMANISLHYNEVQNEV